MSAARNKGSREDAFTLVTLMILVTLLNVMVAVALPLWTQQIKREKEEELIFRGLQYAEAIRLFQQKVGRYPLKLEELLEIEPRSIRQLWKDPMRPDGKWGLIMGEAGQPGVPIQPSRPGQDLTRPGLGGDDDDEEDDDEETGSRFGNRNRNRDRDRGRGRDNGRGRGRRDETETIGPISGVHSLSEEASVKVFMGATQYSAWIFTPELLPIAPTAPGEIVPSLNSKWVGRPFPDGVEPADGTGLEDELDEEPDTRGRRQTRGNRQRRRDGG